jgi:hypothetical protein
VTEVLALQISNETSPPVKTLISSSNVVVLYLAFQRARQPNVPSPLDEVMAVVLNGHYFYEFTRIVCCPIYVSQVEILGMLLTSTRNLVEWENVLF